MVVKCDVFPGLILVTPTIINCFHVSTLLENFLQGGVKVLLLSSSPPGGWLSERVENLFLSPAFFLGSNVRMWRHTQRFLWRHRIPGCHFSVVLWRRIPRFFLVSVSERKSLAPPWKAPLKGFRSATPGFPICSVAYHVTNYVLGFHPQNTHLSHS